MQSIVLINCYFGKFPWYFPFFIKSCVTNPTIDFIVFSDAVYTDDLPKNVRIIPFSLSAFNLLATKKLGFDIDLKNAYKLCDFKPAYGVIFSEYLTAYDFWGMCDIDIILGRIREFMTEELLDEYDVINTRHDYLTGSFMLFRNGDVINNLFTKSKDYKKVFTSDVHYCFDECNFKHAQMEHEISIFDVPCEIESMEHIIRREMELGSSNVFFDFLVVDGLSGKLKWDNGVLGYDNKFEILLYHLIQYKSNVLSQNVTWFNIPNVFFIDKYTFRKYSKKNVIGFFEFVFHNKLNPLKSKIIQLMDYFCAVYIIPKRVSNIDTGHYKNKLGQSYIQIEKDEKKLNTMLHFQFSNSKDIIIRSKFNETVFFLKGISSGKFKKIQSVEHKTTNIQKNHLNGTFTNFEISCNNSIQQNKLETKKTVLITGGSRGIGFALANQFLENGYKVIGTSTTGEISGFENQHFEILKLDLSDDETINNLDKLLEQRNLEIDILINNAGIGPDLDRFKPEKESFKKTFEINVIGTVFLTELLYRHIKNGGKIINISSKKGSIELCDRADSVAYRMSKTALNMYTKILANRLLGKQFVASVHPGWVRTTIAKSNVYGRFSAEESALKIFNFVISDFETGIFWNIENETIEKW